MKIGIARKTCTLIAASLVIPALAYFGKGDNKGGKSDQHEENKVSKKDVEDKGGKKGDIKDVDDKGGKKDTDDKGKKDTDDKVGNKGGDDKGGKKETDDQVGKKDTDDKGKKDVDDKVGNKGGDNKGGKHEANKGGKHGHVSVVPEANVAWVLIPFFGAVLLFSWRQLSRTKA
jgi:hypothetical protein